MSSISNATVVTAQRLSKQQRSWIALPLPYEAIRPLVAAIDAVWMLLLGVGTGAAHNAAFHSDGGDIRTYIGLAIAVATLFFAFAQAAELHRPSSLLEILRQIKRAVLIWIMVFACLSTIAFVLKISAMFSRGATLLFFSGGVVVIVISRVIIARTLASVIAAAALSPRRIALVGASGQLVQNDLLQTIERYGYSISRVFVLNEQDAPADSADQITERISQVVAYARSAELDEIILAIQWSDTHLVNRVIAALRVLPIPVKLLPDSAIGHLLTRPLSELGPTKIVEIQRAPLTRAQRAFKQVVDRSLAGTCLLLLIPLFVITALAIRLDSPGPAFFLQVRVGFNGRRFRIFKFRTMSTLDNGPVVRQAQRNDLRVTRLGRLLRKLSIDELPQLINVMFGEMSLVGPRPHALAHDDEYDQLIESYAIRRKMKPGITGWAQVNGCRGETPYVEAMRRRVEHDLWYIEYWSVWLDIRILLLTVVQVLRPRDVY